MLTLNDRQKRLLESLVAHGFCGLAFPLYPKTVGVRKGDCAALLEPVEGDGFRVVGDASWLVEDQLTVQVARGGRPNFVWKNKSVEATPERLAELAEFRRELDDVLSSEP